MIGYELMEQCSKPILDYPISEWPNQYNVRTEGLELWSTQIATTWRHSHNRTKDIIISDGQFWTDHPKNLSDEGRSSREEWCI